MKYYRVIKENFLWDVGAILKLDKSCGRFGGYIPIDDMFIKHDDVSDEYLSPSIVENSGSYFERVYKVDLISKTIYKIREEAKELLTKEYKD